jgi:hypothetical protein
VTAASRRFSSSASKKLAGALGVVVLCLAGAATYAFTREDDDADERRAALTAYVAEVNMAQQELAVELVAVNEAYRGLRLEPRALPRQLERLDDATATLAALRGRVGGLTPPADGRTLHRELLSLLDLQAAFGGDVAGLARYLAVEVEEQRAVARATQALTRDLSDARTAAAQQAAFRRYAGALDDASATLERATAPAVIEPSRLGELDRLERLRTLARELAAALRDAEPREVDLLFRRFAQATADTGTTKAERDAVVAFNRRLREIADQRNAVLEERARLDQAIR